MDSSALAGRASVPHRARAISRLTLRMRMVVSVVVAAAASSLVFRIVYMPRNYCKSEHGSLAHGRQEAAGRAVAGWMGLFSRCAARTRAMAKRNFGSSIRMHGAGSFSLGVGGAW